MEHAKGVSAGEVVVQWKPTTLFFLMERPWRPQKNSEAMARKINQTKIHQP